VEKAFLETAPRIGAGLAVLAIAGCARSILDPVGPVGADDAAILIDALLIMLAIVNPTIGLAFWIAWRYRASNTKAEYRPNWSYSGRIEAVSSSIPILTIMFIGGVIWIGSYRLDPFRPLPSKTPALEVEVVALDWKWLFIYPRQGIATVNQLVVPSRTDSPSSGRSGGWRAWGWRRRSPASWSSPGATSMNSMSPPRRWRESTGPAARPAKL
jgi:cytochrome o ubiquinol oxidase subunit 2